jgi:hypothetical protein
MAIMLDPHFKVLCVVENLVGCGYAIWLVFEYDVKVVIPFLMVCFDWLNPSTNAVLGTMVDVTRLGLEKDMFGVGFHHQLAIIQKSHVLQSNYNSHMYLLTFKAHGGFNIRAFVIHKHEKIDFIK